MDINEIRERHGRYAKNVEDDWFKYCAGQAFYEAHQDRGWLLDRVAELEAELIAVEKNSDYWADKGKELEAQVALADKQTQLWTKKYESVYEQAEKKIAELEAKLDEAYDYMNQRKGGE